MSKKRRVIFRPRENASEREVELAEWLISDLSGNQYESSDLNTAQFARVRLTSANELGYLVRMAGKGGHYPKLFIFAFEGEMPADVMNNQRLPSTLYIHQDTFVNDYVVFSTRIEGRNYLLVRDNEDYQYKEREPRAGENTETIDYSVSDEISHPFPPVSALESTAFFDFTDADEEAVEKLLEKIRMVADSRCPLYLNWEFRFPIPEGEEELFGNGLITPEQCRPEAGDAQFSLPFHRVSTHFLMDVTVGTRSQYPFNALVFYESGGASSDIQLRGYFAGQVFVVPTAYQVELRPIAMAGASGTHGAMLPPTAAARM